MDPTAVSTIWLPGEIPVLVSTIDLPLLRKYSWWGQKSQTTGKLYAYTIERVRKDDGTVQRVKRFMHRVITNCPPELIVDHRDRNRLNNTRPNLRVTTTSFNNANREFQLGSHSGYRGVYRQRRRWRAQLGWEGERLCLGTFDTPEEAARAYDAKAMELYGEFAWYNFPPAELAAPEQIPF